MNPFNAALETEGRVAAINQLDLDSVAALIFRSDGRYLLQHRENRGDVSYPNWWSLFGGARDPAEHAADALRRELREELGLTIQECQPFLGGTYEIWFEKRLTRKIVFSIEIAEPQVTTLVLNEGQAMAWFTFDEILARGAWVVPYDLSAISLHRVWWARART